MAHGSTSGTSVRSGLRRMVAALLPAIALMAAGCTSGGSTVDAAAGDPSAILAVWRSFPANADPRPPVLTGPRVLDPQAGFRNDRDREAYYAGRFALATALPAAPATTGGYPLISAKAALEEFFRANPDSPYPGTDRLPRLRIVTATLGQAYFEGDRGPRRLPAWRFGLERVPAPVWVLAVEPRALWTGKPTSATDMGFRATRGTDDRTLRLEFIGGRDEPTPCGISYTARAVESATAVVIRLDSKPQRRIRGQVSCDAVGYLRTVPLRLAAPLAGRVLLTPFGVPLRVPAP